MQIRVKRMVTSIEQSARGNDKLKELNLQTLEERRKRAYMIQTYKIAHGLDKVDKE